MGLISTKRTLLSNVSCAAFYADFAALTSLPTSWLKHERLSHATMVDANGLITYAPNNLLTNSASLSTQTVTSGMVAGYSYLLNFAGSGSVTLSGAATGTYNAGSAKFTATSASLTLTVSGTVTNAVLAAVTYETMPRPQDQVVTGASAYYGPRFTYDPAQMSPNGVELAPQSNWGLLNATVNNSSFPLTMTNSGVNGRINANVVTQVGVSYRAKFTVNGGTAGYFSGYVQGTQVGGGYQSITGTYTIDFVATGTSTGLQIYAIGSAGSTLNVTSVSVQQLVAKPLGLLIEEGRGNLFANSSAPATQNVAVTAQAYTLSFYGTGSITLSGAYSGTLTGPGAYPQAAPAKLTFTPTAGTLTLTVSGTVQYPNLEVGSFPTSYIPTGATVPVNRVADSVQIIGGALAALQGVQGSVVAEFAVPTLIANSRLLGAPGTIVLPASGGLVTSWNGSASLTATGPSLSNGNTYRSGLAWSQTGRSLAALAGADFGSDTGLHIATGNQYLGSRDGSINFINGPVSKLAIYNKRLPDAVLKAKTVLGAKL